MTRKRTSVSGIVEARELAKTETMIYVYSESGAIYTIDCAISKAIFRDQENNSHIKIKADLVKINHLFHWPVCAEFSTGGVEKRQQIVIKIIYQRNRR